MLKKFKYFVVFSMCCLLSFSILGCGNSKKDEKENPQETTTEKMEESTESKEDLINGGRIPFTLVPSSEQVDVSQYVDVLNSVSDSYLMAVSRDRNDEGAVLTTEVTMNVDEEAGSGWTGITKIHLDDGSGYSAEKRDGYSYLELVRNGHKEYYKSPAVDDGSVVSVNEISADKLSFQGTAKYHDKDCKVILVSDDSDTLGFNNTSYLISSDNKVVAYSYDISAVEYEDELVELREVLDSDKLPLNVTYQEISNEDYEKKIFEIYGEISKGFGDESFDSSELTEESGTENTDVSGGSTEVDDASTDASGSETVIDDTDDSTDSTDSTDTTDTTDSSESSGLSSDDSSSDGIEVVQ